jgi:hypothetical protein
VIALSLANGWSQKPPCALRGQTARHALTLPRGRHERIEARRCAARAALLIARSMAPLLLSRPRLLSQLASLLKIHHILTEPQLVPGDDNEPYEPSTTFPAPTLHILVAMVRTMITTKDEAIRELQRALAEDDEFRRLGRTRA